MEVKTLIIYLIASVVLFIILNHIEEKKDPIHYGFVSCIYLLIVSGICTTYHLSKNNDAIFIVSIFELLLRIINESMIKEKNFFKNKNIIQKYILTLTIVFCLNTLFISKVKTVFLNLEQVKMTIWLLIIIYILNYLKYKEKKIVKEKKKKIEIQKENENKEKKEYIIVQYAKLKNKYSTKIKTKHKELIPLIYAIMIYENKNRPELFRKLDYHLYKLNGKANKFGIMQIYSKYYIDDENSISVAIRRLEKIYYQLSKKNNSDRQIIKEYYKKENVEREVLTILNEIKQFNKK